jgi:hypothetical protein
MINETTTEFTREEALWVKKIQKLLNGCPSDRLGFYTIGDNDITIFDNTVFDENDYDNDKLGFCQIVDMNNARLGSLDFPSGVLSTAG